MPKKNTTSNETTNVVEQENEVRKMRITSEGILQSGIKYITWQKNIDTWKAAMSIRWPGEEKTINYTLGFNVNKMELLPVVQLAIANKEKGKEAFEKFYNGLEYTQSKRNFENKCEYQSDVVGVSYNQKSEKWTAAISIENRKYILLVTEVQEDAETIRREADQIKERCETTITESGIIDYNPLYDFLAKLRIEKQQSRVDARAGKGRNKKKYRRFKEEEHVLAEMQYKYLNGQLAKELKEFKTAVKEDQVQVLAEFPNIQVVKGNYYIFVEKDEKKYFVGHTSISLQAVLFYYVAEKKMSEENWVIWYENVIQMGLKPIPKIDELLEMLNLSGAKYNNLNQLRGSISMANSIDVGNTKIVFRDYRNIIAKATTPSTKPRIVYQGVTTYSKDNMILPLKGISYMLYPGEEMVVFEEEIENLRNVEDVTRHENDFWKWYIFESGVFEEVEKQII